MSEDKDISSHFIRRPDLTFRCFDDLTPTAKQGFICFLHKLLRPKEGRQVFGATFDFIEKSGNWDVGKRTVETVLSNFVNTGKVITDNNVLKKPLTEITKTKSLKLFFHFLTITIDGFVPISTKILVNKLTSQTIKS